MEYKLRSLQNPAQEILITTSPTSIGRSKDNQLKLPGLPVSRHHAQVFLEGGTPIIVDMNSFIT